MNKTLKLFDKFSKLYEQEEVDAEVDVQSNPVELSVAAEKYLTKLVNNSNYFYFSIKI